jgi:hypothetical protein
MDYLSLEGCDEKEKDIHAIITLINPSPAIRHCEGSTPQLRSLNGEPLIHKKTFNKTKMKQLIYPTYLMCLPETNTPIITSPLIFFPGRAR